MAQINRDTGHMVRLLPEPPTMESMRSSAHRGGPTQGDEAPDAGLDSTGVLTLRRPTSATGALPPTSEGLRRLDFCIRAPEERGLIYVKGPPDVLAALERHLCRRARAVRRPVVSVGS